MNRSSTGQFVKMSEADLMDAALRRFSEHIGTGPRCWEWKGFLHPWGYGVLSIGHRRVLAHRFSYELCIGPIPAHMFVCHHCDNPPCVRPDHLFLGTHRDNMQDMARKRRYSGFCDPRTRPRGERHGRAKFTPEEVALIRRLAAEGQTKKSLARQFGVSDTAIRYIVTGRNWAAPKFAASLEPGVLYDDAAIKQVQKASRSKKPALETGEPT